MYIFVATKKLLKLLKDRPYFVFEGASVNPENFHYFGFRHCFSSLRKRKTLYLGWGYRPSSDKIRRGAEKHNVKYCALEDAFIRSFDLKKKNPTPAGIVIDQSGIYYDATQASDLENYIQNHELTTEQFSEARSLIQLISKAYISKYNGLDAPLPMSILYSSQPQVLVVDQVLNDVSIEYGLASTESFQIMLDSAMRNHPNSKILIKVHPDTLIDSSKQGCIDWRSVQDDPRVEIISERVNPWQLLTQVDVVYTVSSLLGFEALLVNKTVYCFGMPFYAGWGLTYDCQVCDRRTKQASIEAIFYHAYVSYASYVNPLLKQATDLRNVCYLLHDQRRHAERMLHNFICIGFSAWKKQFLHDFLELKYYNKTKYIGRPSQIRNAHRSIGYLESGEYAVHSSSKVIVWASSKFAKQLEKNDIDNKLFRMEDGFLRSVGLGADLSRPCSLVVDQQGIYYDATRPSDLEDILQNKHFAPFEIERASLLIHKIVALNLSKYNHGNQVEMGERIEQAAQGRKIILVPGQVESDASIQTGCVDIFSNIDLLKQVREENPDAYICYKPHPDVLYASRKGGSLDEQSMFADEVIIDNVNILNCFEWMDELHTMTSLSGFEALLRNKKVVTYGLPFYAGWGLTQDRHQCERRSNCRTLEELVAACLIDYPIYVDPISKKVCNVETIVERLHSSRNSQHRPRLKTRIIRAIRKVIQKP